MRDLECEAEVLEEGAHGVMLRVGFSGDYPDGSLGNDHARRMSAYVREVVAKHRPGAVLFDMAALHYEFGDAIGTIAYGLRAGSKVMPGCVVATGTTAAALKWFFEHGEGGTMIFHAFGMRLFNNIEEGTAFLRHRLDGPEQ